MGGFTFLDTPLPRDDLAARLFAGEIVVHRGLAPMARLVALSRAHTEAELGPEPERAAERFDLAGLRARAGALRRAFHADPEIREAFTELFAALGFAAADTFSDRRVLRVVPPGPRREERVLRSLPPHRDSWGSNIAAQINWWAPVYPLTADRTLLLFPGFWARPIANTTPDWNLDQLYAARERGEAYPQLPLAKWEPDAAQALACTIEPGDLLCFSAAQLHASAPNASGRARISLETRTVSLADLDAGRGAPNIDGAPGVKAYRWFSRLSDDAGLEEVAERARRPV